MNRNSLIIVGGILALIILGGLASAIVPALGTSAGEASAVEREAPENHAEMIEIPMATMPDFLPDSMVSEDGSHLVLNPWIAIFVIGAIVTGGLVAVGGGIAFASTKLERTTVEVKDSADYKDGVKAIQTEEKERLKEMNTQSPTFSKKGADYDQPRWSVFSTGVLILLFVAFTAIAVSDTFYPHGEMMVGGEMIDGEMVDQEMINAPNRFMGIAALVTLGVMGLWFRPRTLDIINGSEDGTIPWDSIYVVVTGFIFIVAGIGLIIWLRQPVGIG